MTTPDLTLTRWSSDADRAAWKAQAQATAREQAQAMIERYHDHVSIPLDHKSGFICTLTIDGQTYTAGAGCECPASDITIYSDPRCTDKSGERTVILVCHQHGPWPTMAIVKQEYKQSNQAVFGWVEARFERDKRVQWGKASKPR